MRKTFSFMLLASAAIGLAACGNSGSDSIPEGQTVARVDNSDVTIHELNAELSGAQLPTGAARKPYEQAALQRIIDRRILADLAREKKLDDSPDFVLLKQRAEEQVLVELLQKSIATSAKKPTIQEAKSFITANPTLFANRKVMTVDQILFPMPKDNKKLQELAPLKTLTEVEKWLIDNDIQYRRQPTQLDTLQVPPEMASKIVSLPAGEVFVVPANGAVSANVITDSKSQPVSGDEATNVAMRMLGNKAIQAEAAKELEAEVKKRRDAVTYQAGFAPPKAPGAPAAKPAAAVPAKL